MRQIVKKDKHLILARNTWTELEGKLFATLIKELNPKNESDFRLMRITIDDLEKLWDREQVNTTRIREVCLDLQQKAYEIPLFNENGKKRGYQYFSLFHRIKYEFEMRYIEFQFHDDMKPFLIEFANQFVKYDIQNILRFKSKYTLSFYEYFKLQTQFKKEPMITEIITIEELREWLDLNKNKRNKSDKYTRTNDLKTYILDVVSNDMKKHSDVYMNYQFIKTGRTVTHIKFDFTKNLAKPEREHSFFDEDELTNEYEQYLNKPFLNNGKEYTIKVLTPMGDFWVATYEDGATSKIKNLEQLKKLIDGYKKGVKNV